ncbi:MAG: tRNA (N6-isopentenyl adenosine(37)-C2)-methylthiotransferase MiaB [bacterium]|nr:tRNA (N6-isopentenyl adenosine(37)-C2)-methylthiotransferase MiaB [bacterium]
MNTAQKKLFYIETFGCQMNKGDSELMSVSLRNEGFLPAETPNEADIAIFNTCSVRQHAEDRAMSRIKSTKHAVRKRKGIIVITGCMAQRVGEDLVSNKVADLVIGPYESPKIGEILSIYFNEKNKNIYLSQDISDFTGRINDNLAGNKDTLPWHKWVTITHGCENFCAYCIVPYVRGKLISFKSETILDYISLLAGNGIREITLLGQNVNQFGQDSNDIPFYELLGKTAQIEGVERVNFLTSHPKDFSENIISVIKEHKNISRSIHLPLQSGSNNTLQAMNRKYNREQYYTIFESIDKKLDDYSLTTDLIVGFPGESEQDYEDTLTAVRHTRFDDAFMYAYSPREGTPAFKLQETLSRDEKIARLNNLISIQRAISKEKLEARIGNTEEVIIEKVSKKSSAEVMGKTFFNHPVVLAGSKLDIGKKIPITITGINGATLTAKRIDS